MVTDGNVTTFEDGEVQMLQSLVVRNDDHDLLTIEVDVSIPDEIFGNMKLDGQADFCDQNADSVCSVAVQSSG